MEKSKVITTPMLTSCNLDKDKDGTSDEKRKYQVMIGYLLYLTTSFPDIMFVFCICAWFQESLKESHLNVVKYMRRYLFDT